MIILIKVIISYTVRTVNVNQIFRMRKLIKVLIINNKIQVKKSKEKFKGKIKATKLSKEYPKNQILILKIF